MLTDIPLFLLNKCASLSRCLCHLIRQACILLLFSYFNVCLSISLFPSSVVQPGIGQKKQVAILKEIKEVASGAFHAAVLRYVLI